MLAEEAPPKMLKPENDWAILQVIKNRKEANIKVYASRSLMEARRSKNEIRVVIAYLTYNLTHEL